jgi:hypothetical protein
MNTSKFISEKVLNVFCGLGACSWVPHWACHYYRLETNSTFVVGSWNFSTTDSMVSLFVYSFLIAINIMATSFRRLRVPAFFVSGCCHILIGSIHLYRLFNLFPFEVIGHSWSLSASAREAAMVIPFGIISMFIAFALTRRQST